MCALKCFSRLKICEHIEDAFFSNRSPLTQFRLDFFGQSVTGGGAPRTPPPVSLEPIMLGS